MFNFKITKHAKNNLARAGIIKTTHGKIPTPVFMPCATVGSVKGISSEELKEIGFNLILANTYHLYLRPGDKLIKKLSGLHQFMNWPGALLTDSGGYQIFSLGKDKSEARNPKSETNRNDINSKSQIKYKNEKIFTNLVKITKEGVEFKSYLDGSKHQLTPERAIKIQRNLKSDIAMVLDICTEYPATKSRAKETMELTHSWARRAIEHWQNTKGTLPKGGASPGLFGIVQGSVYQDLREESAKFISNLPFDGIAVGGISVGEGKTNMYKVMQWVGPLLPKDKPHYLMGVGEPEDIIEAVKWGFDMFDCVLPTRLGRHGTVWATTDWQKFSKMDLRKSQYRIDKNIIMKNCRCPACRGGYSRAYISHLIREKEILGLRLTSLHNLSLLQELITRIRQNL